MIKIKDKVEKMNRNDCISKFERRKIKKEYVEGAKWRRRLISWERKRKYWFNEEIKENKIINLN